MPLGATLQLFNGATPQANLTGIQALWWDVTQPKDASTPVGRSDAVTTDASGYINLDLSNVSGLTAGDYGFLVLYKLDGTNHQDSQIFAGKVQTSTVGSGVSMQPATITGPWVRNPSWLSLPSVSGLQKLAGLHAVWPESNFLAFTVAGAYTVDWGDGVVENFTTGATAYHQYDYNDVDLANTNAPVTLTDAGDLVTRTAHGYADGRVVKFYNITGTTGLTEGQTYYVISATANTFQVSASKGGAAVALTTDGAATLLPYKQAIVTITPQGGQNLTSINLNVQHNQSGLNSGYASGWLDIAVEGGSLQVLTVSANSQNVRHYYLEQFSLTGANQIFDSSYVFKECRALQSIASWSSAAKDVTAACTTNITTDIFTSVAHGLADGDRLLLQSLTGTTGVTVWSAYYVINATADTFKVSTTLNGAAVNLTGADGSATFRTVSKFDYMFEQCRSLASVALFSTSIASSVANMFSSCSSLESVPLFDLARCSSLSGMFSGCTALTTVPKFNTSAAISFASMFSSCIALTTVPLFDTPAVTSFASMFSSCNALTTVPLFDTSAATNLASMFNGCAALKSVPAFNTSACTALNGMFQSCFALQEVPALNTSACTNFNNMFSSCVVLELVPAFDMSAATSSASYTNMFSGCVSLSDISATGFKYTFSVASCKLSAAALNKLYTNLATVTGQTITVSSNWGTAADDPTIAVAKGWTVTG